MNYRQRTFSETQALGEGISEGDLIPFKKRTPAMVSFPTPTSGILLLGLSPGAASQMCRPCKTPPRTNPILYYSWASTSAAEQLHPKRPRLPAGRLPVTPPTHSRHLHHRSWGAAGFPPSVLLSRTSFPSGPWRSAPGSAWPPERPKPNIVLSSSRKLPSFYCISGCPHSLHKPSGGHCSPVLCLM